MIRRICRVELAVCNLNRSAVCFVMADAVRNVPKCVRIGAARLYTLAFGCQLICNQPEIRRRLDPLARISRSVPKALRAGS